MGKPVYGRARQLLPVPVIFEHPAQGTCFDAPPSLNLQAAFEDVESCVRAREAGAVIRVSRHLWPLDLQPSFPVMQAAFEDVEFCVRARKAGVVVTYDPDAVVRHHYDHTWPGLFRCAETLNPKP